MRVASVILAAAIFVVDLPGAFGWVDEREAPPFLIRTEFPLHDVNDLVSDLTDLQDDIERQLNLKCQPTQIQIHLFRDRNGYANYLRNRVPEGLNRQALFVQGTDAGRVYAYRQLTFGAIQKLEVDVRHETTHALLHTALPYVPVWIDEGIAEYFEVPPGQREKQNPHHNELRTAIRFRGWKPDIERLEAFKSMSEMKRAEDYRDAWGVVHFMIHGPREAKESLSDYLKEIDSGKPPVPLSKHLRHKIPNLNQRIVDHLR